VAVLVHSITFHHSTAAAATAATTTAAAAAAATTRRGKEEKIPDTAASLATDHNYRSESALNKKLCLTVQ
jgi:hypothetical protein